MIAQHSDIPTVRKDDQVGTLLGVLLAVVLIIPDVIFLLNLLKPKMDADQCQK